MAHYDHSAVREAHKNGARIQFRLTPSDTWQWAGGSPCFFSDLEYRVDPASIIPATPYIGMAATVHPVDAPITSDYTVIFDSAQLDDPYFDDVSSSNLPSRYQVGDRVTWLVKHFGEEDVHRVPAIVVSVRFSQGKVRYDLARYDIPTDPNIDSCDVEAA